MSYWVYILKCNDGSYYTGHTDQIQKRIIEHHEGVYSGCYTKTRRPLEVVFQQAFPTRLEALSAERRIKGWCRKKKEALIAGNWQEVSRLSKSKNSLEQIRVVHPFD